MVNLVSKMSLGEGLDVVNLLDSTADKINQKIVFLMKVHVLSGLSKVEEKQQFQIIVKKDLQDPER